jgi:hypothetical protein
MSTVVTLWACKLCCWVWPEGRHYCGICGKNRADVTACPQPLHMVVGAR